MSLAKLIVSGAASLFSLGVLANAHVGEYKTYAISQNGAGTEMKSSLRSYNQSNDSYVLAVSIKVNDREFEASSEEVSAGDVWTREKAQGLLENCQNLGGTLEVTEVAGSEMGACHFQVNNEETNQMVDLWMGDVPVDGIIRLETEDGSLLVVTDYHWN